ncbi:MAG: restriction endonuclease subunit S [Chloroflexi bacterium]|nr:restriction endonuclease subunit S [Chloroflexota bacterium]
MGNNTTPPFSSFLIHPSSFPMTFTRFADVITLPSTRTADPLAAGIERFVGLEHIEPENLHIRSWGLVAEGTTFTNTFQRGQVLFGKRRAYQRKVAVAEFDGVCSSDIYVFESKDPQVLLPELLPFILQSEGFYEYAVKTSAGSLSPRTNWTHLANYEFPLLPVDEQRRIADLLWAADDAIVEYQNVLSTLENLESSLVAKHTQPNDDWPKKQIREFADVAYGLTVDSTRRNLATEKPYLRVANVWRNSFDFSEIKNIGADDRDEKRYRLLVNDVLVVEGHANVDEIGRAALWEGQLEGCLHQNHILRIRVRNDKEIQPKFLLTFINSPTGKNYMKSRAKSTSGLNTINSTVLNTMEVPIPSYEEQEEIMKMIGEVENAKAVTKVHLENSFALKKQLLATSLGG